MRYGYRLETFAQYLNLIFLLEWEITMLTFGAPDEVCM